MSLWKLSYKFCLKNDYYWIKEGACGDLVSKWNERADAANAAKQALVNFSDSLDSLQTAITPRPTPRNSQENSRFVEKTKSFVDSLDDLTKISGV